MTDYMCIYSMWFYFSCMNLQWQSWISWCHEAGNTCLEFCGSTFLHDGWQVVSTPDYLSHASTNTSNRIYMLSGIVQMALSLIHLKLLLRVSMCLHQGLALNIARSWQQQTWHVGKAWWYVFFSGYKSYNLSMHYSYCQCSTHTCVNKLSTCHTVDSYSWLSI